MSKAIGWLLTPLHLLLFALVLLFFHVAQALARPFGYGAHKRVVDYLNLGVLAKSIYKPGRTGARRPGTPPARRPAPGQQGQPGQTGQTDQTAEKKGLGIDLNPLKYISAFLGVFEPINLTYGQRFNRTMFGIAAMPTTAFQFGLSDTTGVPEAIARLEVGDQHTSTRASARLRRGRGAAPGWGAAPKPVSARTNDGGSE